ncbi:unnamed protein product [Cuscuta epithymum]|uniref:RING-type E3 ubiquitin transferase n=1 Tax=Cuscuta epithymum TaxID=186058 RepID=A0AAV0DCJ9_9ASTE|nr:unnamed protein product [Cuscuta epithymum]
MGHYSCDMDWSVVEIDTEDDPDLQRSMVRIYLKDGYASYGKTWWLDHEERGREKDVLYRFEKCVDVSGECAWTSDLEKILQGGSEEEELMTLFTDKVLSPFKHLFYGEALKYVASVLIRGCRDGLIPLLNHNPNSKLYSISLAVSLQLSVTLGVEVYTLFKKYYFESIGLEQPPPGLPDYDQSTPMPLPRIVRDGYGFFQLGGRAKLDEEEKTCAICFGKYEPLCLVIRLQCLNELLPEEEHSHEADTAAAMLLPCQHIFHANCITRWFQVSVDDHTPHHEHLSSNNTCPLCRFRIPTHYYVVSLVQCFPQ